MSQVHPQARTTPRTRTEIHSCADSLTELALRYTTTVATMRKWQSREDMQDRTHCPHTLNTTLSPDHEALVVELRRLLLLPLDDLLVLTREFINLAVWRSGLNRCLVRHGVATLASLTPVVDGAVTPKKTFKDYEPGFVHMAIEHRLCPPRHPQTNGMVERFNGRRSDLMAQTRFSCAAEQDQTLKLYLDTYNHRIPQRALDHRSPIQALKAWREKKPEPFVKQFYEQAELDT